MMHHEYIYNNNNNYHDYSVSLNKYIYNYNNYASNYDDLSINISS